MAKRNSTWKRSSGRNRLRPSTHEPPESLLNPLHEAIEDERARLGKADSVLGCLSMALMDAEQGNDKDLPYFADVADVARKLVRKSINQLDSVRIGPLIDRIREPRRRS